MWDLHSHVQHLHPAILPEAIDIAVLREVTWCVICSFLFFYPPILRMNFHRPYLADE